LTRLREGVDGFIYWAWFAIAADASHLSIGNALKWLILLESCSLNKQGNPRTLQEE
jgi:hypothetical protein